MTGFIQGDVKVYTDQCSLALEIEVFNGMHKLFVLNNGAKLNFLYGIKYTLLIFTQKMDAVMDDLNITIIQTTLFWEDSNRNLEHFSGLIRNIPGHTDLIMLPEMFNTGFSMNPEMYAEEMGGPATSFLKQMAAERKAAIAATVMLREGDHCVNRLLFYFPDGNYTYYDKRHLFRIGGEDKCFRGGNERRIITLKTWKLLPMICYDLRFPVWSKNRMEGENYEYDLLFYLANWPIVRSNAWRTLLVARAMENMAYVAGVNRVGKDGNEMDHTGDSMVVDPRGNTLFQAPERTDAVHTVTLSYQDMKLYRESFAFGYDWDKFTIH